MQCTNPVLIRNPYPQMGKPESFGMWVPCGKCVSCRIARAREWSTRLLHEASYFKEVSFITLTIDDDHMPFDMSLHKQELQLFFKRLRKFLTGTKLRYYACGEYGEKRGRPHYHAILFGFDDPMKRYDFSLRAYRAPTLERFWKAGNVTTGSVNYDSIRYVADYIGKSFSGPLAITKYYDEAPLGPLYRLNPPFRISSLGLGKRWAEANSVYVHQNLGVTVRGVQVGLPRYYRKVLNIEAEEMAEKAQEHESSLAEHYAKKGFYSEAERARPLKEARKQADTNAKGRLRTFKRDKF